MGWLDATDDDLAVEKAMKQANRTALPITARSLTATEMQFRTWRLIILGGVAFALFALLMAMMSADDPFHSKVQMATFVLTSAVIGFLVARWWLGRQAAYRDPRIKVEAGADGIIVTAAGGAQGMRWSEIEAQIVHYRTRNSFHYCGIRLQSPFGTVDLRDERYRNGKAAASVIIRGKVLAEETRRLAKIGIEGV